MDIDKVKLHFLNLRMSLSYGDNNYHENKIGETQITMVWFSFPFTYRSKLEGDHSRINE